MKNHKKTITVLLTAAALLITVFVTGCTKLSEVPNNPTSEADVSAESDGSGVYVKLEREDAEVTWGSESVCLWRRKMQLGTVWVLPDVRSALRRYEVT